MFIYELSGCGFESSCSHLDFGFSACFEQEVPWHSGSYRVWIHSETRTWLDKNIQSVNEYFISDYCYYKKLHFTFTITIKWIYIFRCGQRFVRKMKTSTSNNAFVVTSMQLYGSLMTSVWCSIEIFSIFYF